ncbi:hypothetical protein MMC28_002103 [Mycoblastus sanguinarius]|nr:hypothetical protein [Mycoblastus sanguinarius]
MAECFSTLPPEMVSQIMGNVEKSSWLLNLALCCHSLYDLTLPFLYSHVTLPHHGRLVGPFYLKSFTYHILRNPHLASRVRDLIIDDWRGTANYPADGSDNKSIDEVVRKLVNASSHSKEQVKIWIKDLKSYEEAWITLLLPLLPNLERLDLMVTRHRDHYFGSMIQRVAKIENPFDTQPAFSSLRVLVANCDRKCGTTSNLMFNAFQIPSLREFYGQRIFSDNSDAGRRLALLETATLRLTHLEVRHCVFNIQDLTNMLRSFKTLKTFVYNLGSGLISSCTYSMPELRKALTATEENLENLWLDRSPHNSYYWPEGYVSPMSSLSSFKPLKNLQVGMYILFGGKANLDDLSNAESEDIDTDTVNLAILLPTSIETLYFSQTNGRIRMLTRALENLLEQKESSTPKLKRIAFEAFITGNPYVLDFSHMDDLAEKAGVEIAKVDTTAEQDVNQRCQGMDGSLTWAGAELSK